MTNEEFQRQIEQILAVQRNLQESDLRRAEQQEMLTEQQATLIEQQATLTEQIKALKDRQDQTDDQIMQLVQLMTIQGQRLSLVTEAMGLQDSQIQEIYGRLGTLENS